MQKKRNLKTKPILVKDGKLFGDEQGYKRDDVIPDSRLSPIPNASNTNKHVEIIEIDASSKKSNENPESIKANYRTETNRSYMVPEQQFMMTSHFKIVVKGVSLLPMYFNLQFHSVCHPRAEVSMELRQKKMT